MYTYIYIYIYTHTYIRIQCCRFLKTCGIFTTPWFRSKEQFLFSEIWRRIFRNAAPVCHECALEFSQNIWFSSVIMPGQRRRTYAFPSWQECMVTFDKSIPDF